MCYDCKDIQTQTVSRRCGLITLGSEHLSTQAPKHLKHLKHPDMASSIQATRLRKGMLVKLGNDLCRILDLHHLTPGNKRAHIQVRMRNIRSSSLMDHK